MSTQLRLLANTNPAPLRARAAGRRAASRRGAHWREQWRLDPRTREVGRAGVASARAALARAHADDAASSDLRRAS